MKFRNGRSKLLCLCINFTNLSNEALMALLLYGNSDDLQ